MPVDYIRSVPYYGGKSGRTRLGKWVTSLLPQRTDCTYVELCAGMAGILLQREPSKVEVLNDLNDRVVNFWRVLRDDGEELVRLAKHTPYSYQEYNWAAQHLDDKSLSPTRRALAFLTVIEQNLFHGDGANHVNPPQWALKVGTTNISAIRDRYKLLELIRERIHYVQLYNGDASVLVKKTLNIPYSVIYFDPPYTKRNHSPYAVSSIDVEKITELFQQHKGAIAISGCDGEWNHLGWERHDLTGVPSNKARGSNLAKRSEQVWTNYALKDKENLW